MGYLKNILRTIMKSYKVLLIFVLHSFIKIKAEYTWNGHSWEWIANYDDEDYYEEHESSGDFSNEDLEGSGQDSNSKDISPKFSSTFIDSISILEDYNITTEIPIIQKDSHDNDNVTNSKFDLNYYYYEEHESSVDISNEDHEGSGQDLNPKDISPKLSSIFIDSKSILDDYNITTEIPIIQKDILDNENVTDNDDITTTTSNFHDSKEVWSVNTGSTTESQDDQIVFTTQKSVGIHETTLHGEVINEKNVEPNEKCEMLESENRKLKKILKVLVTKLEDMKFFMDQFKDEYLSNSLLNR